MIVSACPAAVPRPSGWFAGDAARVVGDQQEVQRVAAERDARGDAAGEPGDARPRETKTEH